MRIPMEKAAEVLRLMVEGMSVRSIERVTQVHRDMILRLLLLAADKTIANINAAQKGVTLRGKSPTPLW